MSQNGLQYTSTAPLRGHLSLLATGQPWVGLDLPQAQLLPEVLVIHQIKDSLPAGLTQKQVGRALYKVMDTMTHVDGAVHPGKVQDLLDNSSSGGGGHGPVLKHIPFFFFFFQKHIPDKMKQKLLS